MKGRGRSGLDEMRPEYHFDYSKGVRGKYYRRLTEEGATVVLLDPDVAKAFRTSAAVNEALRNLLKLSDETRRLTARHVARRRTRTHKGKRQ